MSGKDLQRKYISANCEPVDGDLQTLQADVAAWGDGLVGAESLLLVKPLRRLFSGP
jgi:hypothetical protein